MDTYVAVKESSVAKFDDWNACADDDTSIGDHVEDTRKAEAELEETKQNFLSGMLGNVMSRNYNTHNLIL